MSPEKQKVLPIKAPLQEERQAEIEKVIIEQSECDDRAAELAEIRDVFNRG